ncbi:hypothetical protein CBM2629_U30031 [Cupriavidus taiwanensis]|nr:hypothetical protein CBM2629_U30031 [Cupriavidus taiwanensis]
MNLPSSHHRAFLPPRKYSATDPHLSNDRQTPLLQKVAVLIVRNASLQRAWPLAFRTDPVRRRMRADQRPQ